MNERNEKQVGQLARDNAILSFVNYQAQEAILDPNLPDSYKDEGLKAAVRTIQKLGERKAAYFAKHGEGRRTRRAK